MTKIEYRPATKLNKQNQLLLDKIVAVVEDYGEQGYKLTLRQLYYQLVSQDIIANKQPMYAKISRMLTDARMSGQVDWDIIEDRTRVPKMPSEFENMKDLIEAATQSYRLDRWAGQENYVEVWVEKDALSGVLLPITRKFHVHLMVNKGYSSVSAMHDAALRIREKQDDKNCTILYLGDHDPSGEDMVRDIDDRLREFGCEVEVNKIALTMAQIRKYNPPPNPVKFSDPRSGTYEAEHGNESWELDALNPKVLNALLIKEIGNLLDSEKYQQVVSRENKEKKALERFGEDYVEEEDED